ncbi:hypothetical protein IPJ72_01910 [Candidatus Peregrinibacteria bacterium]|nr:MAG: hypothetical protein IPJ72_01910 [Candidatus Peregrinibacteria bacterium]
MVVSIDRKIIGLVLLALVVGTLAISLISFSIRTLFSGGYNQSSSLAMQRDYNSMGYAESPSKMLDSYMVPPSFP